MPHGLGVKLLLAAKVSIEAAVRETGGRHDLADRDLGKSSPIEQTGGGSNDPLPRLLFVPWRVRHRSIPSHERKDDPEHPLASERAPPVNRVANRVPLTSQENVDAARGRASRRDPW